MGDPWSLLCTRSPDGGMIAFIKHPDIPIYAPDTIQWFRTQDASKVYDLFPNGYTASDVAFSPDSKYLAFFGCTNYESNCGVFLLNTQTQEQRKLKSIGTAAYFTWSPDGQSLALLGSDDLGSLRVFIIKIDTGEVTYTGPVDWKSFATAPDSPTRNWGVPFPGSMGGLEACVTRPIP
jgi:WD40 repeat protein